MVSTMVVSMVVSALSVVISVLHDLPTTTGYHSLIKMIRSSSTTSHGNIHNNNRDANSSSNCQWNNSVSLESSSTRRRRIQCRNIFHSRTSTLRSIRTYLSYMLCTVLLHQFTIVIQPTAADLYVENNTYPTLPALFGRYMVDGKTYEARLQYFHDNPYLCNIDDKTLEKFVPPTGGIQINHIGGTNLTIYEESVALLVVRGNCPFQEKATVAEYIHDSVKVLLIANFNLDNVPEEDETLVPMYSQHGDTRLVLLGISHATGQALKKYLSEIPANGSKLGGPIVQFDSIQPYGTLTEDDLESMMFSALGIFFMLISFTGCLIILTGTYHQLLMHHQNGGENPITAATQRRLLTEEEVQQFTTTLGSSNPSTNGVEETLPSLSTNSTSLRSPQTVRNGLIETDETLDNVEADQCAVCLGEFDNEEDIAILPCRHKFHTTCITPWLTERQSKCPLCKFDVLQHIRDQSSISTTSTTAADDVASDGNESDTHTAHPERDTPLTPTASFWDQLRRHRWTSIATDNNDDTEQRQQLHLDGVMRVVEALSTNDFTIDDYDDDYDNIDRQRRNTSGFEMTEQ